MADAVKIEEKGVCRWCMKPGIVSFVSLKTDVKDPRIKKAIEELNARAMANKLIKIADGVYACKECVSVYRLRVAES